MKNEEHTYENAKAEMSSIARRRITVLQRCIRDNYHDWELCEGWYQEWDDIDKLLRQLD
jgi:hypothetical protein